MAYASVADMVARFGQAEMIRASTPDGAAATVVVQAPISQALDDASALIDTYLRKRYGAPLDIAPPEISRACCMLARYDLSLGGEREASEQIKKTREETISWLKLIAKGEVDLDLAEVNTGDESFSAYQTRTQVFNDQDPDNCATDSTGGGSQFWSGGL